ncbi:MAG TPA: DsrE/DsrF/DrsH-like family protein [Streptosporangiaceae bacterium]|nr:DsrE/DsrF/DrsH-like family protein [Streptosporangiaceae bacterium]
MENADGAASAAQEQSKRMAMICWSNDLDKVWPVLILATTGAASGLEVDIFFTFWGLRVLQRNNKRITGKNWMQKGESVVDRGGTDHLKLGKIHFGGAGTKMIKNLAGQYKVASPTDLLEMAIDLGVRLHPCQMTMDLYGLSQEDFIDGLQPTLGAASFIDMAVKADITLFI